MSADKNYKKLKFSTLANWKDIKDNFNQFRKLFPGKNRDFISLVRIVVKKINLIGIEKYILKVKNPKKCVLYKLKNFSW